MSPKIQKAYDLITNYHNANLEADDDELDAALSLRLQEVENDYSLPDLLVQYGGQHRLYLGDTSYHHIRTLYQCLEPFKPRKLLDLGSGYGRILFYGALLWPSVHFTGIEMVSHRVSEVLRVRDEFNLSHLQCIQGDVTNTTWPQADIYCLINSFTPSVMPIVVEQLRQISCCQSIILASASTSNLILEGQGWLEEVPHENDKGARLGIRLFKTAS